VVSSITAITEEQTILPVTPAAHLTKGWVFLLMLSGSGVLHWNLLQDFTTKPGSDTNTFKYSSINWTGIGILGPFDDTIQAEIMGTVLWCPHSLVSESVETNRAALGFIIRIQCATGFQRPLSAHHGHERLCALFSASSSFRIFGTGLVLEVPVLVLPVGAVAALAARVIFRAPTGTVTAFFSIAGQGSRAESWVSIQPWASVHKLVQAVVIHHWTLVTSFRGLVAKTT